MLIVVSLTAGSRLVPQAAAWAGADPQQCFEQPCQDSPFMMHASKTANSSIPDAVMSCFQFVSIGCYAAPKGCCPEVARRFTGLEFDVSKFNLMYQMSKLDCASLHSYTSSCVETQL